MTAGNSGVDPNGVAALCTLTVSAAASNRLQRNVLNSDPKNSAAAAVPDSPAAGGQPDRQITRLLEQLLQIARASALEEMASGFAHELNQPIGAIATFAQAAQRMLARPDPMLSSVSDVLQHISNEAMSAGQGIRRIRSLFNGREVERSVCELPDVLAELQPVLELLAARAAVALDIVVQAELPSVCIDRLRIQHVLFTLVQNALEAPRRAGAAPKVRIEMSGDRYAVVTAVVDQSAGIAPDAREQLFRPFFTTKRHGTGLGLASSRAILEAHEGTIGFEDASGGGARFWFRLPAASGAAP